MRTNIVIDDKLMDEAMTLSRLKTKKAVVETGLKLLVQIKKQEQIKSLRGKLNWDSDLDVMRLTSSNTRVNTPALARALCVEKNARYSTHIFLEDPSYIK